jgi:hypothetical protein
VKSLAYGGMLSIVGGLSGYDGAISSLGLLNKTAARAASTWARVPTTSAWARSSISTICIQ